MEIDCDQEVIFFTPENEHDIFRLGKLAERVESVGVRYFHEDGKYTVGHVSIDKDTVLKKLLGEVCD